MGSLFPNEFIKAIIDMCEADEAARRERATQQKEIGDYLVVAPIDVEEEYDFDEYELLDETEKAQA